MIPVHLLIILLKIWRPYQSRGTGKLFQISTVLFTNIWPLYFFSSFSLIIFFPTCSRSIQVIGNLFPISSPLIAFTIETLIFLFPGLLNNPNFFFHYPLCSLRLLSGNQCDINKNSRFLKVVSFASTKIGRFFPIFSL